MVDAYPVKKQSREVGPETDTPWHQYYENTKLLRPSSFLANALETYTVTPGLALDLGCGAGRDSNYLLERGFRVQAVDNDLEAGKYLQQLPHQDALEFICTGFNDFIYEQYDIVNAHYSLPFAGQQDFGSMMRRITDSIKPGGLFVGQLFGTNDSWNTPDTMLAFHKRPDVECFFDAFENLQIHEMNKDGITADGTPKHWHVFNIIAQKPTDRVERETIRS